jgi:Protein of unknown function (DUF3060)
VRRVLWYVGAACLMALPGMAMGTAGMPRAHAGFGDTHVTSTGTQETIDCNDSTLFVNGSYNIITATGSCYAVTMQGTGNVVIADNVVDNITVYGWDQTVLYKSGDPYIEDIGRRLGMTNHIDRVPA